MKKVSICRHYNTSYYIWVMVRLQHLLLYTFDRGLTVHCIVLSH